MQYQDLLPPGRVLWAMRDSDLHPSHQKKEPVPENEGKDQTKDKLRLFEVLDVEKVFGQIIFARNMLSYVLFFLFFIYGG
jgi:sn1-specific diacylglycerol lipase